ncbi:MULTISPECIES: hypothetical protein [Wolbachia]|uniref:hypothetical protein n=1 Tax=Wolbachia TaxID=953 RepID=UPI0002404169|nr:MULTISPECIES: hypothetical protein [Wolbachia]UYC23790.1 hypothetical protein L3551_00720 [Wolbachia endosymbiont of Aedes aegypti]CCE77373.1 conserved hypothetical protein [Wolbachia pipientis wAlbB]
MDFDKAGNAEDLYNEKLQLICKTYNRELLSNQRVVDGINSMDYSKLKILCKYHNKFSHKGIEELLLDESIVNHINDYDDEMFRSMLNDAPSEHNILEILKGEEVRSSEFDSSDGEENEEDYGYYDNFDYEEDEKNDPNNFAKEALGDKGTNEKRVDDVQFCNDADVGVPLDNQNAIRNIRFIQWMIVESDGKLSEQNVTELLKDSSSIDLINSLDDKKLQLILKSDKFSGENIIELLGNQRVVEYLYFIDYEKFELIHNSDKFNSSKYASSSHKIIRLLENQELVKHINFIDYEKLQFILCNDKFPLSDIIRLLKNQEVVENIISFNIEKFRLIFYSDKLNCVDTIELLENQKIVDCINSITPEKLELIFGKFSLQDIIKVLENIAPEKSELIFEKFSLQDIIEVLEDQNAVKGINSVTTQELKAITDNVTGKVFVNIFKNFKPSVKSTLRLAILLRKAGKITDINIDYLNNKERIYEDIIKYVPQELSIYTQYPFPGIILGVKDLPQEQDININSLVPFLTFERYIECKEPVSKLYNLSLEQVIENINPHKRARYF